MNVLSLSPSELRQLANLLEKAQGKPAPAPAPKAKPAAKRATVAPNARKPKANPTGLSPEQLSARARKAAETRRQNRAAKKAADAPASPAAAQEARKAKVREWARAARERKRTAMAERAGREHDAAMGIPAAGSADMLEKAKRYSDAELATASGLSRAICADFRRGRACGASVVGKLSEALALLDEATDRGAAQA